MGKIMWTAIAVVSYGFCGVFFALFLQALWFYTLGSGDFRGAGGSEGFGEGMDLMLAAAKTIGFWILPTFCGVAGGAFMGHLEYTTGQALNMFREPAGK